jgi:hypothetical protein
MPEFSRATIAESKDVDILRRRAIVAASVESRTTMLAPTGRDTAAVVLAAAPPAIRSWPVAPAGAIDEYRRLPRAPPACIDAHPVKAEAQMAASVQRAARANRRLGAEEETVPTTPSVFVRSERCSMGDSPFARRASTCFSAASRVTERRLAWQPLTV